MWRGAIWFLTNGLSGSVIYSNRKSCSILYFLVTSQLLPPLLMLIFLLLNAMWRSFESSDTKHQQLLDIPSADQLIMAKLLPTYSKYAQGTEQQHGLTFVLVSTTCRMQGQVMLVFKHRFCLSDLTYFAFLPFCTGQGSYNFWARRGFTHLKGNFANFFSYQLCINTM